MKGGYMNAELERMWTEAVVAYFKVKSRHMFERLSKMTGNLRIVGLPDEILTRVLPNTKQEC
jgi:hypothetical protein